MKRSLIIVLSLLLCRFAAAITLNGVNYTIDTLAQYPAGPGATYLQVRMQRASDGNGRLDCYLLAVDTRNPYVGVEQILGQDKLVGTERPSAMAVRKSTPTHLFYAGVNGDFFVTQGDVGRPTGLTIVNNEFAYTPANNRRVGGIDEQLRAAIGTKMTYSGKLVLPDSSYTIHHVNYLRAADELVLYNQHNGATTGTNMYGTELRIRLLPEYAWTTSGTLRAEVLDKQENIGNMAIPQGEAVLSGHGTMQQLLNTFVAGDTLTLKLSLKVDGSKVNMSQCIGGDTYALIVNNGEVEQSNYWNELHPRTAYGCSEDKQTLYFLVVDGRGASTGCTTKVLGEIIHYYGAYTAVNWDGGGSSCMYLRPFGQVNKSSDGTERAVGNAMFAVANVPEEVQAVEMIAPYQPICNLPRYAIMEPKFLGYNRYGVLVDTCVQGVQLSCDASLGTILADGRFLASGTQSGLLHATLPTQGGSSVSCDMDIRLLTAAPVAFRLDSVMIDRTHPYQVQIQSTASGKTYHLQPDALTWLSEDENVAIVDHQGNISATGEGYTRIIGVVDNFSDTLLVHVVAPVSGLRCWDNLLQPDSWELTATADFDPQWQNGSIAFTYAGGRAAFVRFEGDSAIVAIPDTIRIPVNSTAEIQKVTVNIRPDNATATQLITLYPNGVPTATDVNLDIPVRELLGEDAAIFPLHFEAVKFFISASTSRQQHTIGMQGIWLIAPELSDELSTIETQACSVRKILTPQGLRIIRDNTCYDVLGTPIK